MLENMKIKFGQKDNRRVAYTDRRNGYLEYKKGCENNGYYRQNKRYFSDVTVNGHSLGEADEISVMPQGIEASFGKSDFKLSLLIDDQAFYFSTEKNFGLKGLVQQEKDNNGNPLTKDFSKVSVWNVQKMNNICIASCQSGIAIAAPFDFYIKNEEDNIEVHISSGENKTSGWYVTFEENEASAVSKAEKLVSENAIDAHFDKIKSFIEKVRIDSGDSKFDEAYTWARFNGWLLATKDHGSSYRGIWAGLPWFRDNWGRDTFISINGILLASGCFEEAKDVLLGFAGFQDKNQSSETYGRIPNRYRDAEDVIYNTADGTLWFIRAVWEYVQYSGDLSILDQLLPSIELALDADIKRSDGYGFLMHGDADTWMDARMMGENPLSPRGNRANDIQALWFTALRIGAIVENLKGRKEQSEKYAEMAAKVQAGFERLFFDAEHDAVADHLPAGGLGDWAKDWRVRPNQLFAITVPSVLPEGNENRLVSDKISEIIIKNVNRELVTPFGLYSLSSEDPLFHPEHENPDWYHKDAAYHNGTIWEWNSGAYISAACTVASENGACAQLPSNAGSILLNESKMILDYGCAGSLSENIHARPDAEGNPKLSGTFSQAWSVAEYVRNISQDLIGFVPRLAENKISINPHFAIGMKEVNAEVPFGKDWVLKLNITKKAKEYKIDAEWRCGNGESFAEASRHSLSLNGTKLLPDKSVSVSVACGKSAATLEKFCVPEKWITNHFEKHDLNRPWCGSEKKKDYLFELLKSGRMNFTNGACENTGALEWYFDSEEFEKEYTTKLELGAIYSRKKTLFRLWAPTSRSVKVLLFEKGNDCAAYKTVEMKMRTDSGAKGVWEAEVKGDLHGTYYQFVNMVFGVQNTFADPYAKACGVNGNRSMVVDLSRTNPDGWESVKVPEVSCPSDVIAYEVHVADITSSPLWNGPENLRRTFKGAVTEGTSYKNNPTGFDYIKSLGITHVQILPMFDFRSVDETKIHDKEAAERPSFGIFNWGYDPENYAVPEGSYSTDPYNGTVRIKECKEMIMGFAKAGIGVVMDVVYNHVNDGLHHGLGLSVPGYFFRQEAYSGAGEDTASERPMFRKYMVDTLSYWLKEYKLSGFRFDLMGLHDVVAMNEIKERLSKIKKDVLIYGEGWDMYHAGKMEGASQRNHKLLNEIGFFNDAIRCAIKGPVFDDTSKGFIHNGNRKEALKFGIVGATNHPQVDFKAVEGTSCAEPWGEKTWLSVNYTEIHDNITLADKEFLTEPGRSDEYYAQIQKMAISLFMLAEGMPILHAGMEFMRTKEIPSDILKSGASFYDVAYTLDKNRAFLRNTYNVCDRINNLDWERSIQKKDVVEYVKNLIALRKEHPAFRIAEGKVAEMALNFIDNAEEGLPEPVLAWMIDGSKCNDDWVNILVVANPLEQSISMNLPGEGTWKQITDGVSFEPDERYFIACDKISIKPKAVVVFSQFRR